MRLKTIYELIDGTAPFRLSRMYCEAYGAYDNSGLLIDCGREIEKILFSLDCSPAAVARAKETGANLIVSHHPVIYSPVSSLKAGEAPFECVKAGISVISAHLNLDIAAGGIDECLMKGLGGEREEALMHTLAGGGYGRLFHISPRSLVDFVNELRKTFQTARMTVYGDRPVQRVASFCGAGMDGDSVSFAKAGGADTFVSSDGKHHLIAEAVESGLNVVLLTHYAAEAYGFGQFYQKIKKTAGVPCELFTDPRLM